MHKDIYVERHTNVRPTFICSRMTDGLEIHKIIQIDI